MNFSVSVFLNAADLQIEHYKKRLETNDLRKKAIALNSDYDLSNGALIANNDGIEEYSANLAEKIEARILDLQALKSKVSIKNQVPVYEIVNSTGSTIKARYYKELGYHKFALV